MRQRKGNDVLVRQNCSRIGDRRSKMSLRFCTLFVATHWGQALFEIAIEFSYSGVQIRWQRVFWAGNQVIHQNFDKSLLTYKCWLIFMRMKQKKFKMADSKKGHFPAPPILNISSWKFHGFVLGLVGLIDAKGIDVAQPTWLWGCLA